MDTSTNLPVGNNDIKQPATATFREMKEDSDNDDDDDSNSTTVVEPPSLKRPKIGSNENDASVADATPRDGSPSSASAEDESSTSTDVSRKNKDDDDDSEEEEQEQQEQGNSIEQRHLLDSEDVDLDDDEYNSDDAHLYQEILAAARAGRIPLEFLAARGIHFEFDDEPVEYPFDHPPTSIEDVADFIQSEKCQRIMILAG